LYNSGEAFTISLFDNDKFNDIVTLYDVASDGFSYLCDATSYNKRYSDLRKTGLKIITELLK